MWETSTPKAVNMKDRHGERFSEVEKSRLRKIDSRKRAEIDWQ